MAGQSAHAQTLTRRDLLRTACTGAVAAAGFGCAITPGRSGRRPNIVFLLTDDQRWDALGCMGNPIVQTPHLDALAGEGTLFTNHFATTPICMSSRASIFTGFHTRCHGIEDFNKPLSSDVWNIAYPMRLRAAGYRTGFIGKWGLGGTLPEPDFDYFDGFAGQGKYFPEGEEKGIHLTSVLGGKAVDFIRASRNSQPFCLSVSFKAPHVQDEDRRQYLYDPALKNLYRDIEIPPPPKADAYFHNRLPEFIRTSEGRKRWEVRFSTPESYQESVKGYYRLVTGMDLAVGRIMGALASQGLDQNTVVIFTSDQGVFNGERGLAGKWLLHEESIRAPLIVLDPRLAARRHGRRCDAMSLTIDLSPTMIILGGAETSPAVQGRDLGAWVRGERPEWRTECFFEHHFGGAREPVIPASEGIRTERWKYIRYVAPSPFYQELYDLAGDPLELRNHACETRYAGMQSALEQRWKTWTQALAEWRLDATTPWRDPVPECSLEKCA